jgi:uncharacterized protein YbjT (DUF2867 family)
MQNDNVLVIGATGSIGAPLVQYLLEKGERVKAATRRVETYPARTHVEAVHFDYDDPATIAPALSGVNRIFMLAAPTDPDPDQSLGRVIELARASGVERVVLVTSLRIKAPRDAGGFLWGEKPLQESGLAYSILRPGWFMQTFTSGFILAMIKERGVLSLPAGQGRIGLIDTRDIAACAACALTEPGHDGQTYLLTGGETLGLLEIARIIAEVRGQPLPYADVSMEELERIAAEGSGYPGPIEYMAPFFNAIRDGLWDVSFDTVAKLTGRPPISFAQFAKEHAAVWR